MQVGAQQRLPVRGRGQVPQQRYPGPGEPRVDPVRGTGSRVFRAAYSASNSSAHAWHISASGRNGQATCGCAHSRRSSPATTRSWSGSGSTCPSGVPGLHRSRSSAYPDSLSVAARSRTAPCPSQARRAAAGATQEHWPPGSNGSPTRPPVRQAGHQLRQVSDPAAQARLAGRGLGQVAGHRESLHERTLPAPGRAVNSTRKDQSRPRRGPASRAARRRMSGVGQRAATVPAPSAAATTSAPSWPGPARGSAAAAPDLPGKSSALSHGTSARDDRGLVRAGGCPVAGGRAAGPVTAVPAAAPGRPLGARPDLIASGERCGGQTGGGGRGRNSGDFRRPAMAGVVASAAGASGRNAARCRGRLRDR